jgi:3-isopropylmalate dehydrogenase
LKRNRRRIDFIIFRELTGGIYFAEKSNEDENKASDLCEYSEHEIELHISLSNQPKIEGKSNLGG